MFNPAARSTEVQQRTGHPPLTRNKIIGFDSKSMVYRFLMMEGNRPVECSVSNAIFKYLEKNRYYSDNVDAVFLRWREQ